MRRTLVLLSKKWAPGNREVRNLIQIQGGTFYREHPSAVSSVSSPPNPPLFPNLHFALPATQWNEGNPERREEQHWAVISAADGTAFLEVLRGQHICLPPNARKFPYLSSDEIDRKDHRLRTPSRAIQYVGFNNSKGPLSGGGIRGAYLSARYESRREETDWTVLQYLKGETELNPNENDVERHVDERLLAQVMKDLRLHNLAEMPVSNLSNGQTRRARIAKALLGKPELLLLDEPFMGLDPPTLVTLSPILKDLAFKSSPLLLLGLRPQDPVPDWITHLVILGQNHTVALAGHKEHVLFSLARWSRLLGRPQATGHFRHDIDMAQRMTHEYGPPPSGVGDVLTKTGIYRHPIMDYADVVEQSEVDDLLQSDGLVRSGRLAPEHRKTYEELLAGPAPSRIDNLADLVFLTTCIPEEIKHNKAPGPASHEALSSQPDVRTEAPVPVGAPLIQLSSVIVKYGDKTVLGHPPAQPGFTAPGLNLTIRQGTRLALLGPNGSGKTTFLSLLTSDHPQSYSLPIQFFGRSRLPQPGIPGLSLWEIQHRIGHSSPEIHHFFPKHLPVRRVLESAWAETYAGKPDMTPARVALVDLFLAWWAPELRQDGAGDSPDWASDKATHAFGVLPFAAQRLLLLLRAVIKQPDIVILDEAFSGLSADVRDKAMAWLEEGGSGGGDDDTCHFPGLGAGQALVVVSHVKEEIPPVVDEWVRLPGEEEVAAGRGVELGKTARGEIRTHRGWAKVWGLEGGSAKEA